jgi:hypothetical protein
MSVRSLTKPKLAKMKKTPNKKTTVVDLGALRQRL